MWTGNSDNILQQVPRNYMYGDKVFLFEEISTDTCAYLIGDLTAWIMNPENVGKRLTFIINSPGGDTTIMMNIIGLINLAKIYDIDIITFVLGNAASAASLIAVQGTQRIMSKVATHFVHFGSIVSVTTKQSEIEKTYFQNIEYAENIKNLYLEACDGKLTRDKLEKLQSDERGYVNAADCVKYGLADFILEDDLAEKVLNDKARFEFEKLFEKHMIDSREKKLKKTKSKKAVVETKTAKKSTKKTQAKTKKGGK